MMSLASVPDCGTWRSLIKEQLYLVAEHEDGVLVHGCSDLSEFQTDTLKIELAGCLNTQGYEKAGNSCGLHNKESE